MKKIEVEIQRNNVTLSALREGMCNSLDELESILSSDECSLTDIVSAGEWANVEGMMFNAAYNTVCWVYTGQIEDLEAGKWVSFHFRKPTEEREYLIEAGYIEEDL